MTASSSRRCTALAVGLCCLAAAQATLWQDCAAAENITGPRLHFSNVVSDPDPLHTGQQQIINKTGTSDIDATNFTSTFSQYWCVTDCHDKDGNIKWQTGLPWVRFLKINLKCPDSMCPVSAGQPFATSALHPKRAALTPHGWYRSRQVYHDSSGKAIGCADMIIQYVK